MLTVCAQPDGSMSSLLQSTGSSPYVLVHIVGPLAATVPLQIICLLQVGRICNLVWSSPEVLQFSSQLKLLITHEIAAQ